LILGDVTYGACCVDDLASKKLGCDFIVHYGHSCLVPIPEMTISNILYVFVEIGIDLRHLVDSIAFNIDPSTTLYLMGIVQFNTTLARTKNILETEKGFVRVELPQTKPRSKGEVLGCTSPLIDTIGTVVFVGDGRFHIESCMIRNP
jgi:2-(3-amino-3-carboxypropyl)histidine synthase